MYKIQVARVKLSNLISKSKLINTNQMSIHLFPVIHLYALKYWPHLVVVYPADIVIFVVGCLEEQVAFPPLHLHPQLTFVSQIRTARLPHLNNRDRAVNNGLYKDGALQAACAALITEKSS